MRRTIALLVLGVLVCGVTVSAVTVTDVYNAPNPLVTETTFYLVYYPTPHDFDSVVIKIYDLSSQQVAQPYAEDANRVTWNGTNFGGEQLANGTYLYKAYVYEREGNGCAQTNLAVEHQNDGHPAVSRA